MTQLTVKPGNTMKLPPNVAVFTAGAGWDPAAGQTESPDLDLWIVRVGTKVDVLYWGNKDWERPDLGRNSQGNPFIASTEGDLVYKGDDRTGAESATGYDENVVLDLSKAPADVTKYAVFVTIYDGDNKGLTLGMATNVKFGVKDEASGNELVTDPASNHPFDVTVALATIDKGADGKWSLTAVAEDKRGSTDNMFTIARALGASF